MKRHLPVLATLIFGSIGLAGGADAADRCFFIEFMYDSAVDDAAELREALDEYAAQRGGVKVIVRDVQEESHHERAEAIRKYFRLDALAYPAVYGANHVASGLETEQQLRDKLDGFLTMTAFVRNGCPHCRDTKAFLAKYQSNYPALRVVYREVTTDRTARSDMQAVVRRYKQSATSLPVLHFCNQVTVGFDSESRMGRRILQKLEAWVLTCPEQKKRPTRQRPEAE